MKIQRNSDNENFINILVSLVALSIPTMVEQLLSVLMVYVDTAMVGRLGEKATAAVSTTGSVNWLIGGMSFAFGVVAMSQISRAVGEGNHEHIKRVAGQTLIGALIIGTILEIITLGVSPFIPVWMGAAEDVRRNASIYFAIICIPQLIKSASVIFASAIRATKDTKTPMLISLGANGLNIVLNYLFIYVLGLGVIGAAIGTAISATVSGLLMYRTFRKSELLHFEFKNLKLDASIMKSMLSMFFPVLASNFASGFAYVVFASMVSRMGTTVFAAHSIAINAEQLFYIAGYGLKSATSTMVGICYGERNKAKFKKVVAAGILMVVTIMTLNGALLYIFANPLMMVFTNSMAVVTMGAAVLKLVAISEPMYGVGIVAEGVYYGLGKSKYPLFVVLFSMWGIRIVSTAICVTFFNANLNTVWMCMIADNMMRSLLFGVPLLRKNFGWKEETEAL